MKLKTLKSAALGRVAATLLLAAACLGVQAQTNLFYTKGEMVAEIAPTMSSANLFSAHTPHTCGCSFETEYWESAWTGTGLEVGSYNSDVLTYGIIDHTAIMQDFRFAPFPGAHYFSRLAVGLKTGAETFYVDGSKDVEIGGELYWTLGRNHTGGWSWLNNSRLEMDVVQHERTNPAKDGQTGRIGWQILF